MKDRLLGLFGRRESAVEPLSDVSALLVEAGVSEEAVRRALEHRHLLRTRQISTLVEEGEITELAGAGVLSRLVGRPGLCLGQSVIDLSLCLLPETLAFEHLLLPICRQPHGGVILATADRIDEQLQQEVEAMIGGPVRQHLALHYYLQRAIRACYQLRQEREDAAFLVGSELVSDDLGVPPQCFVPAISNAPIPEQSSPAEQTNPVCVLIGTTKEERIGELTSALSGKDCRILVARDGLSLLRLVATASPNVVIADPYLPTVSSLQIFALLESGERFSKQVRILMGERPAILATQWSNTRWISEDGAVVGAVDAVVAHRPPPGGDCTAVRTRSRVHYFEGMVSREKGEVESAKESFLAAIKIDPLFAAAHMELARLELQGGGRQAEQSYTWAHLLGAANGEDLANLATLTQRRGDLITAASLWRLAADELEDDSRAQIFCQHAATLLRRRPGSS